MPVRIAGIRRDRLHRPQVPQVDHHGREQIGGGACFANRDHRQAEYVIADPRRRGGRKADHGEILARDLEPVGRLDRQNGQSEEAQRRIVHALEENQRFAPGKRQGKETVALLEARQTARENDQRIFPVGDGTELPGF